MKEKNIQTVFNKHNLVEGFFELKLAKKNCLPFKSVAEHQLEALLKVSTKDGLFHKITDQPWGKTANIRYTSRKPFDCFYMRDCPAYIVICWYKPRKQKEFHYIPVQRFIEERDSSARKSLTEAKSNELSSMILSV